MTKSDSVLLLPSLFTRNNKDDEGKRNATTIEKTHRPFGTFLGIIIGIESKSTRPSTNTTTTRRGHQHPWEAIPHHSTRILAVPFISIGG